MPGDCPGNFLQAAEIDERGGDLQPGVPVREQRIGAAVEQPVGDDVAAGAGQNAEHSRNGCHAAGKGDGNVSPLRVGEILFQHILVGFAKPIIDVDRRLRGDGHLGA